MSATRTPADLPLALTMGEPAGIAGEITAKAWRELRGAGPVFFLIGDPGLLHPDVPVALIQHPAEALARFGSAIPVLPLSTPVRVVTGKPTPSTARAVIESIDRAVAFAREGSAAGVVTNPIQKSVLHDAGFGFPGHTEYLAAICGTARPVMMIASPQLRVVPVTIHEPLAQVPSRLSSNLIVETAEVLARSLRDDFGIREPRIAVTGLNPHAGESGSMGTEDDEIIAPAVAVLRGAGYDAFGPLPADTMFHARARAGYDAALCMYHDQALIPIKTLDFDEGVNVTLGLPIVRTSPDHGTALDIAGQGVANAGSLVAAIRLAGKIARHRAARQVMEQEA